MIRQVAALLVLAFAVSVSAVAPYYGTYGYGYHPAAYSSYHAPLAYHAPYYSGYAAPYSYAHYPVATSYHNTYKYPYKYSLGYSAAAYHAPYYGGYHYYK